MPGSEPRARGNDDEATELDFELAEEIARFVADRALLFESLEHRAWALTDFATWASLASCDAELSLVSRRAGGSGEAD